MLPQQLKPYQNSILSWYLKYKRELPWRLTGDPYLIWISEVMLQQTQVISAIPYYQRFVKKFPTISDLANSDLQSLLKLWEGLGYYSRARNLRKASRFIMDDYQGLFPETNQELIKLPGIGPYIAAAVSSIAFNLPFAVVDGNVKRVLSRLYCDPSPVNDSKYYKNYQTIADQLLVLDQPGDYNQAIMELGALICRPKQPDCLQCPVSAFCQAFGQNQTAKYPFRVKKKKVKTKKMISFILEHRNRLLMVQNKENGLLGGLWTFPQYEKKRIESFDDILEKIIPFKSDKNKLLLVQLEPVNHIYTHFKENILPIIIKIDSEKILISPSKKSEWYAPTQIKKIPITGACQKILGLYQKYHTQHL